MPHAQDREELGRCLPTFPPTFRRGRHRARRSRAAGLRDAHRHLRQIKTPLGFRTEQITNAYRVHEPTSGFGLLATLVFATESNSWTPSAHIVESLNGASVLNPESSPLHQALARWEKPLKKGAAPVGAAKSYPI
jgi:hypothetical protein